MGPNTRLSPLITPSDSVSNVSTSRRSIESTPSFVQPNPPNRDIRIHHTTTYRRNYLPRTKRQRTAWYWQYGTEWDEEIGVEKTALCWICSECVSFKLIRASGGTHIVDHLRKHHGIRESVERSPMLTIRQSFAQADTRSSSPPTNPSEPSKSDRMELPRRHTKKR